MFQCYRTKYSEVRQTVARLPHWKLVTYKKKIISNNKDLDIRSWPTIFHRNHRKCYFRVEVWLRRGLG